MFILKTNGLSDGWFICDFDKMTNRHVISKPKAGERYNRIRYRSFSSDVTAAILVYQNNEMAAILVYGTGISSFLFKYFVLFHHPTGATDHVSENDLQGVPKKTKTIEINVLLEFECLSTLLNTHVHQSLT